MEQKHRLYLCARGPRLHAHLGSPGGPIIAVTFDLGKPGELLPTSYVELSAEQVQQMRVQTDGDLETSRADVRVSEILNAALRDLGQNKVGTSAEPRGPVATEIPGGVAVEVPGNIAPERITAALKALGEKLGVEIESIGTFTLDGAGKFVRVSAPTASAEPTPAPQQQTVEPGPSTRRDVSPSEAGELRMYLTGEQIRAHARQNEKRSTVAGRHHLAAYWLYFARAARGDELYSLSLDEFNWIVFGDSMPE